MTLNEKIVDSVSKTTGIRCFEGMPPDGIVGRFAYFFPLRSGAAKRYNEVAIFFMERPVFTPLSPEKATNDCRYLALNWLNGLYAYSGLKFQDILSQNNTRDGFGGYGVGLRLVLVDEARHTGGGATPVDKKNYFRITHDGGNGNIEITWVGTYPDLEYNSGDGWSDFTDVVGLGQEGSYVKFRLKDGSTWSPTSNSNHFNITATGAAGAVLSGNIMSLVDPTLETTSLSTTYCFRSLFRQCTAIVDASELELADNTWGYCYAGMFFGCTNLETAPELPASSMSSHCYNGMFNGCTSLTEAPELPATTLAQSCYSQMFSGCTAITSAPELPATTLVQSCYVNMFNGCSSLDSITVGLTAWGETGTTNDWVTGVAESGTFTCPDALTIEYADNRIPTGWRVVKPTMYNVLAVSGDQTMGSVTGGGSYAVGDTVTLTAAPVEGYEFTGWTDNGVTVSTDNPYTFTVSQAVLLQGEFEESVSYMTFTALEDNSSVGWEGTYPNLEYSTNGSTWTAFTEPVSVNTGGKVMFRNNGTAWTRTSPNSHFNVTGLFDLSGNIMSLVDATMESLTIPMDYCFYYLFTSCGIVTSDKLELPATTLSGDCYSYMFNYCRSMTNTPTELPATTLADRCYSYMFYNCNSIVNTLDVLPAATVTNAGYQGMFRGCSSLENTPYIRATRIGILGCQYMFGDCTSITSAEMEFNNGVGAYRDQCRSMFYGCTSLNELKVKFTGWGSNSWNDKTFGTWVTNVAATGTFQCPDDLPIVYDKSHIPTGWRVVKPTMYNVLAVSGDQTMGSVTGGGSYAVGDTVTLTATALDGYNFVNWTVNDVEVSTSETYTFTVSQAVTVQGNFEEAASYMTFTALQDNGVIAWDGTYPNLEYSKNGGTWTAFTEEITGLNTGDKVMFRNNGTAWAANSGSFDTWNGSFDLSGNIMSLVDSTMQSTTVTQECFYTLFATRGIVSAENLELPATTLAPDCYSSMFLGCTSLETAPVLPATTLADNCYNGMFYGCTALTTAPELPATTMAPYCYKEMFYGCTALANVRVMFNTWYSSDDWEGWTADWLYDVSTTGDFYCPSSLPDTYDDSHIPSGWTRHNID